MRTHRGCRQLYADHVLFAEWRGNAKNPLYSLETVEGILLVNEDDSTCDIFLPDVQQFIYYIGEQNWPLSTELHSSRVIERFRKIWGLGTENRPPVLPFHDPGERWLSDRESDGDEDDDDDYGYLGFDDFLTEGASGNGEEEDRQSIGLLEEPEPLTADELDAYFTAAEEAGLASQDRRRNARSLLRG
jgi:hypothetical protein